jgi:hypothetical protein
MIRTKDAAIVLLIASLAAAPAFAGPAASPFDPPLKTVRVPLPKDKDNPQSKPKVTCAYFRDFMVKEIDLGEVDAEQLSIVPAAAAKACQRANVPAERVVSADGWSGYFEGVKGGFVVFSAGDGWNGGMGFAVMDAKTGRKLFDDAYKTRISALSADSGSLTMRYRRVFAAKCSLASDAAGCWRQIRQATGLSGAAPECAAAYAHEARRTPKFARQVRDDPTVVDYDVEARVGAKGSVIHPLGGAAACRPAD